MITNQPLILNITNSVTLNFVANGLLNLGASPVMSDDPEDAVELAKIANGICINIGTISDHQMAIVRNILTIQDDKKIVLDPVGSGATSRRTNFSKEILSSGRIHLIRGNASEISSLVEKSSTTKGVDSTLETTEILQQALALARKFNCIIVVSGAIDIVTDGKKTAFVSNGSPSMPKLTGTGCLLTAFLTAIIADGIFDLNRIAEAVAYYGYLGEVSASASHGMGEFQVRFLDSMSNIPFLNTKSKLRIEWK